MNFFTMNSDFDRPERKGHGAKVPGSEMARERKGQGANRPESYWPIRSGERIGPGAKRLGTGRSPAAQRMILVQFTAQNLQIC